MRPYGTRAVSLVLGRGVGALRKADHARECRTQSWPAALKVFLVILLFSNDSDYLLFGKSPRGMKAND